MTHTEINRERSRFYRAEEFGNGQINGRDVAGWVGYYVDKRHPVTGRVYTIEDMVAVRVGASCPVIYR